tara:strand:+ start:2364 stop:2564 length:201 start_codon:yes stop_codon:yes gene_type:complete
MIKKKTELSKDQINIVLRVMTVAMHDIIRQLENTEDRLPWVPAFLSNQLDELQTIEKVLVSLKGDD